jgi:hypothetical protein
MTMTPKLMINATALVLAIGLAQAQTMQEHNAHHPAPASVAPGATTQAAPTQATPPVAPGHGARPGTGMMMHGTDMAGHMGQMMAMMRMTHPQATGPARMEMAPGRHVEGRIAFLKAELGITEAQGAVWNTYADALRAAAKRMSGMMAGGMDHNRGGAMPARMDMMVGIMTARAETMRTVATAAKALYAALSEAQRKLADELLMSPMGGV